MDRTNKLTVMTMHGESRGASAGAGLAASGAGARRTGLRHA